MSVATAGPARRLAGARGLMQRLAERRETGFALALFAVLLVVNVLLNPARFAPGAWGATIGLAAPLIAASIAAMPAILGGRGGIDVSVGPLMGLVNALIVQTLIAGAGISSPWAVVPAALAIGAAVGIVIGALIMRGSPAPSPGFDDPEA